MDQEFGNFFSFLDMLTCGRMLMAGGFHRHPKNLGGKLTPSDFLVVFRPERNLLMESPFLMKVFKVGLFLDLQKAGG